MRTKTKESNRRVDLVYFFCLGESMEKMKELIENTREYQKTLLAEAFENIISEADKNNEISFQNTEYYTPKERLHSMDRGFSITRHTVANACLCLNTPKTIFLLT